TNRNLQPRVAAERHSVAYVGDIVALGDQARTLVDQAVVHSSHLVVPDIIRPDQRPVEGGHELLRHHHRAPRPPPPCLAVPCLLLTIGRPSGSRQGPPDEWCST